MGADDQRGPFAEVALRLQSLGLVPIPCAADGDGKKPLAAWKNWQRPPGADAVRSLAQRFPMANVGIATGLSGVTVVDIDDPELVRDLAARFGDTPLVTLTPSGGIHLWYKGNGEQSANLRVSEGLPVDIKAAGGFLVTPPSIRPEGHAAGRCYAFRSGGWDDVLRLPTLRHGSLQTVTRPGAVAARGDRIPKGRRNTTLFRMLLRHARGCDDFNALIDVAQYLNESCEPQLAASEVTRIAASAWKVEQQGQNFVGKGQRVLCARSEILALAEAPRGSDAALLLMCLRMHHYGRSDFAASPKGMANAGVIGGWAHDRYRNALELLVDLGIIEIVHEGGRGPHDPRRFRFASTERR